MYKRISAVRSIALMLIVVLSWQLWLTAMTIYDLSLGISDDIVFHPMNLSRPKIPPIIHQVWKTSNLSTYPITTSYAKWQKTYPDYTIRLWTDADLAELFSSKDYTYLAETYRSYPFDIQRADLARLVVLHHQGGIYADLDVFPRSRSLEKVRSSGASFTISRASSGSSLINHFLASEQHSKILDYILRHVPPNSLYRRILFVPYLQVFATGSIFLTRVLRLWLRSPSQCEDMLWILSSKQVASYVTHDPGRSWHLLDGHILNLIDSEPTEIKYILLCSLLLFSVFILLFLKYRKQICITTYLLMKT